jgi:hypothetical protein
MLYCPLISAVTNCNLELDVEDEAYNQVPTTVLRGGILVFRIAQEIDTLDYKICRIIKVPGMEPLMAPINDKTYHEDNPYILVSNSDEFLIGTAPVKLLGHTSIKINLNHDTIITLPPHTVLMNSEGVKFTIHSKFDCSLILNYSCSSSSSPIDR